MCRIVLFESVEMSIAWPATNGRNVFRYFENKALCVEMFLYLKCFSSVYEMIVIECLYVGNLDVEECVYVNNDCDWMSLWKVWKM